MTVVEVRSRIVGADTEIPTVAVEVVHEQVTAGQLINQTVESQIHNLEESHHLSQERVSRALQRQYLTEVEMHEQAKQGRIGLSSNVLPTLHPIDIKEETAKAMDAFRRRTFLILVDGKQIDSLDETLALTPSSKIVFLRLTPLVGG